MLATSMRSKLFLLLMIALALTVAACGNSEVEILEDENETGLQPATEDVEEPEVAEPVTSDLWAPPVGALPQLAERLPRAGEVPYPLIPGAQATGYQEPKQMEGHGDTLAYIFLLSSESMESVYDFYKEHLGHLDGWQGKVGPSSYDLWQGDDEDYIDAYGYLIPAVLIMAPWGSDLDFMPDAQSNIILVYEPN